MKKSFGNSVIAAVMVALLSIVCIGCESCENNGDKSPWLTEKFYGLNEAAEMGDTYIKFDNVSISDSCVRLFGIVRQNRCILSENGVLLDFADNTRSSAVFDKTESEMLSDSGIFFDGKERAVSGTVCLVFRISKDRRDFLYERKDEGNTGLIWQMELGYGNVYGFCCRYDKICFE